MRAEKFSALYLDDIISLDIGTNDGEKKGILGNGRIVFEVGWDSLNGSLAYVEMNRFRWCIRYLSVRQLNLKCDTILWVFFFSHSVAQPFEGGEEAMIMFYLPFSVRFGKRNKHPPTSVPTNDEVVESRAEKKKSFGLALYEFHWECEDKAWKTIQNLTNVDCLSFPPPL